MRTQLVFLVLFCVLCNVLAQNVKMTYYDYDYEDIAWSGNNVVFLLSKEGKLYRSIDEGQTWIAQFQDSTLTVEQIHQGTDDRMLVFVAKGLKSGWTTRDAGANYNYVEFGFQARSLDFSPDASGWLLATAFSTKYLNTYDVYVSSDYGRTFKQIGTGWIDAEWGKLGSNSAPLNTIFAVNDKYVFGWTTPDGSWQPLFQQSFGFVFTTKHLFVGVVDGVGEALLQVSSKDLTKSSSYQEAQFPFGDDLPQNAYVLLDDTTGAEWLAVSHTNNWGTIYTSEAQGLKYTSTLKHVHHLNHLYDFAVFSGLEGIYIANNVSNYEQSSAPLLTTVVTFDNGGEWRYLTPPQKKANGEAVICTGDCHLHLHGLSSWVYYGLGPFYSSPNAIGLLLATGNIGASLSNDNVNVYLSRDAGLTWIEFLQGNYVYEYGDHGGIIVFAERSKSTKQIIYTLDEGLTQHTITLDNEIEVVNIVVEPAGTATRFVIIGGSEVIGLDFSTVQPRTCDDSDYELWAASDGRPGGATCLLGRNVTYSRRKQDAKCTNVRDTEHLISSVNCDCDMEDYECDFGFEETVIAGKYLCKVSIVKPPADPPANCPSGTTYERSSGYRIVAGDTCVHPLPQYAPQIVNCPTGGNDGGSSNKGLVAVVVIFVILAVAGIAGFFVYRNEAWREKALSIIGKVIPINRGAAYSRLGRNALAGDEEFGIGGEHDIDDDDVEEDAPELQDKDIQQATSGKHDSFNPRT